MLAISRLQPWSSSTISTTQLTRACLKIRMSPRLVSSMPLETLKLPQPRMESPMLSMSFHSTCNTMCLAAVIWRSNSPWKCNWGRTLSPNLARVNRLIPAQLERIGLLSTDSIMVLARRLTSVSKLKELEIPDLTKKPAFSSFAPTIVTVKVWLMRVSTRKLKWQSLPTSESWMALGLVTATLVYLRTSFRSSPTSRR